MNVPETVSPILYKYRNFENPHHIKLLSNNELFFSAPCYFNDPFDCDIPLTIGGESEEEIRDYIIRSLNADPNSSRFVQEMGMAQQEFVDMRTQFFISHPEEECRVAEYIARSEAARYGVFSLAQIWDNLLMWSHYSNCHSGFCVGFNKAKLYEYILRKHEPSREFLRIFVEYREEYPIINPIKSPNPDLLAMFSVKSHHWSYEKEVRLLLVEGAVDNAGKPTPGTSVMADEDMIEEVVLGVKSVQKDRETILKLLRERPVKPKLYQAVMKDRDFGLDRREISY